jgi:hypothetical protein
VDALAAWHFDGMAHLHNIELVRVKRLAGKHVGAARRRGRSSARHPTRRAADHESSNCCRRSHGRPRPPGRSILTEHLVKLEPLRDRLVDSGAEMGTNTIGLKPPGRHQRGLFGMISKPRSHGVHAVRRQLAVNIGMQLILGYG